MPRRRTVWMVKAAKDEPLAKLRVYGYDAKALADVAGTTIGAVQHDIIRDKLQPDDMWSVVAWIEARRARNARRLKRLARKPRAAKQSQPPS
jgi:hypothetical protein